jgi:hypothetical protein
MENEAQGRFSYRDYDHRLRMRMLELLQETIDRVAEHCLFQFTSGKGMPWKDRSQLSLRFRLKGPLGGVYSDEWHKVTTFPSKETGKIIRRLKNLKTRDEKKIKMDLVMGLARPWEREATAELLMYLHATRLEWSGLSKTRKALHEAAVCAGQPYKPQAIPQVRQRKILDAALAATKDEDPPVTATATAAQGPRRRTDTSGAPDTSNPEYELPEDRD